jgi:hypothetical protein
VQNGRRYRGPVTVEFTRVPIKAGQK